jgi:hypothetical protein
MLRYHLSRLRVPILATSFVLGGTATYYVNRDNIRAGRTALRYKFNTHKYNPLEKAAYTGNKNKYQECKDEIQYFNTQRSKSKLLTYVFPPLQLDTLFTVANIKDNCTKEEMELTLKAGATELLDVFFTNVYDSKDPRSKECLKRLLKYEVTVDYNPQMLKYLASKVPLNKESMKAVFNKSQDAYKQFVVMCSNNKDLWEKTKSYLDIEDLYNIMKTTATLNIDQKIYKEINSFVKASTSYVSRLRECITSS